MRKKTMKFGSLKERRDMSPEEKLIAASETGNTALVKRLIKKGVDVNFIENDELGYTALHYAAFNGHPDIIEDLILAGADGNKVTTDNYSVLMLATLGGFTDTVEVLFRLSKPDLSIRTTDVTQGHYGLTCLHLAVMSGVDELVHQLIRQGAEREAITSLGYTALHLASWLGYSDIVATLLQEIPSLHGGSARSELLLTAAGHTALHLAVTSGNIETVALLLEDDASDANTADPDGYTALHLSVTYQLRPITELLLRQGVAVNTQAGPNLETPLLEATATADNKAVNLLLQYSADPTVCNPETGFTPLIAAASGGYEKVVRSILQSVRGNTNPNYARGVCNQQDAYGYTALHYAVQLGLEGITKRLVDAGAAADIVSHYDGRTALDSARSMGAKRLLEYLQRAQPRLPDGADVSSGGKIDPTGRTDNDINNHPRIPTPVVEASDSTDSTYIDLDAHPAFPAPDPVRPTPLQDMSEEHSIGGSPATPSRKSPVAEPAVHTSDSRQPCLELDAGTNTLVESTCMLSSDDSWEVLPPTPQPSRDCTGELAGYALGESAGCCTEDSPECELNSTGSPNHRPFSSPRHRRGHRAIHAQTPEVRARKREKAQLLREERRQNRLERLRAMLQEFAPHTACRDATEKVGEEPQQQAGSAEMTCLPVEAEAMLQLSDLYEQKIDTVSAQYEARIAILEAQLHSLQHAQAEEHYGDENGSFDWDQEIEFTAPPGTRGESRYAGLDFQGGDEGGAFQRTPRRRRTHKRSPGSKGTKRQDDASHLTEDTPAVAASADEADHHTPGGQRSSGEGRSRRSPAEKEAHRLAKHLHRQEQQQQQCHTLTDDMCTIKNDSSLIGPGVVALSHFDRSFLQALSLLLLLLAIALLAFIRLRLVH